MREISRGSNLGYIGMVRRTSRPVEELVDVSLGRKTTALIMVIMAYVVKHQQFSSLILRKPGRWLYVRINAVNKESINALFDFNKVIAIRGRTHTSEKVKLIEIYFIHSYRFGRRSNLYERLNCHDFPSPYHVCTPVGYPGSDKTANQSSRGVVAACSERQNRDS